MAIIQSGASADFLTVDATSKSARTSIYDSTGAEIGAAANAQPASVSGLTIMGLNDRSLIPARADRFGSLASALFAPLLFDSFEGATINPIRWLATATTMAAAQTTVGGLVINSGNITTLNTGYMLQSARRFVKQARSPLQLKARLKMEAQNNSVMEFGFGDAATFNGANTTGAYWQVTTSGVVQPVVTFNSVDITGSNIRSSLDTSKFYVFDVTMDDDEATFYCQDTSTGLLVSRQSIKLPLTGARLLSATQIQSIVRVYNSGTAPAVAPRLTLTDISVCALDCNYNKPWADSLAGMDRSTIAHPHTGAQLSTWANSAEPASASLSNTSAGYTSLGGRFQFAAVAGGASDYALFGFQTPAPSNLMVTGVAIDAWNIGAAVATTPTLLIWALGAGSTAVSLATATVTRIGLGAQAFAVGAAVGAKADRVAVDFRTPISVSSGRFLHIILRMPVGTATASQIIAGMVNICGYFE